MNMLTTTIMACKCKKIIAPAMNTNMYENPIVQDNLEKLRHYGYEIIAPAVGYLACKDVGAGKLPSEEVLLEYILREIRFEKDLEGKKVLDYCRTDRRSNLIRYALFLIIPQVKWDMRLRELLCSEVRT